MSTILGIGDQVRIRKQYGVSSLKDAPRFCGFITRVVSEGPRYFVTMLNDCGDNRGAPTTQSIVRAIRVDDGRAPEDGEEYVIEAVTGLSPDTLSRITEVSKLLQSQQETITKLREHADSQDRQIHQRFHAVVETLCALTSPEKAAMVRQAFEKGLPVYPAAPTEPPQAEPDPEEDAELETAGAVENTPPRAKRK